MSVTYFVPKTIMSPGRLSNPGGEYVKIDGVLGFLTTIKPQGYKKPNGEEIVFTFSDPCAEYVYAKGNKRSRVEGISKVNIGALFARYSASAEECLITKHFLEKGKLEGLETEKKAYTAHLESTKKTLEEYQKRLEIIQKRISEIEGSPNSSYSPRDFYLHPLVKGLSVQYGIPGLRDGTFLMISVHPIVIEHEGKSYILPCRGFAVKKDTSNQDEIYFFAPEADAPKIHPHCHYNVDTVQGWHYRRMCWGTSNENITGLLKSRNYVELTYEVCNVLTQVNTGDVAGRTLFNYPLATPEQIAEFKGLFK